MIIRNPLLTNGKGSMANMTFVGIQDGGVIAKGKIVNMTNPNSPGQQQTRFIFKLLVAQFRAMKALLNEINKPSTARRSPFNQYMANNIAYLKEQLGEANPSELNGAVLTLKEQLGEDSERVSTYVRSASTAQPTFSSGLADLEIIWDKTDENPNAVQSDFLQIAMYNNADEFYTIEDTATPRSDESFQLNIARPSKGYNFYYAYFKSAAGGLYSSAYGVIAVPVTGNVLFVQTAVVS